MTRLNHPEKLTKLTKKNGNLWTKTVSVRANHQRLGYHTTGPNGSFLLDRSRRPSRRHPRNWRIPFLERFLFENDQRLPTECNQLLDRSPVIPHYDGPVGSPILAQQPNVFERLRNQQIVAQKSVFYTLIICHL